jgi:flagellar biosynthesis protein FlhA
VDPSNVLITHLTELLRKHADELLTRQEVQSLLDHVKRKSSAVVDELIPGLLTLGQVQKVLQLLLRERVSVRDMASILEGLADAATTTKDPEILVEHVRRRLARQLSKQYAEPDDRLFCFTLDPVIEQMLADNIRRTEAGVQVVLEPSVQQRILGQMRTLSERMIGTGHQPLVLCSSRVRLGVRFLSERVAGSVVVLAYGEICSGISVESVGMVSWNDDHTKI